MRLQHLELTAFRNLAHCKLDFSERFNILYGPNGSGKTSLLEAIHFLGIGRSFRTRHLSRIITHQHHQFVLYGVLTKNQLTVPIGLERDRDQQQRTLINGSPAKSLAELASHLPLLVLTPQSYRLFLDGPQSRRQMLDWGVFHVEHQFFPSWQRAQRAIKQRNALLKTQITRQQVIHWDTELIQAANQIDQQRLNYFQQLSPLWSQLCETFLECSPPEMTYYRGWNQEHSLQEVLERSFHRDQQLGYTQSGPHRADIKFTLHQTPAQDVLSQGQLKLAAYALHLAQGILYQATTGQTCTYLIDDLPAELDERKKAKVFNHLLTIPSQVFITGISPTDFEPLQGETATMFHVKHGVIT